MLKFNFKCIELLKKFNGKELEGLTHLTACTHFNTDKYVIKLLNVLELEVLHREDFDEDLYKKVYKKVFSEKINIEDAKDFAKKKLKFNNKLSALLHLAKRFLAIEALETNLAYQDDLVGQKLLEKQHFKLFESHFNQSEKKSEQQPKDRKYYYHKYIIEENKLNYLRATGQLIQKDNLPDLIKCADKAFIADKLSFYVTLLSLKAKTLKKYDESSMKAIKELLDLPTYRAEPFISLCNAAIVLAKERSKEITLEEVGKETTEPTEETSETAYRRLLELLKTHASVVSKKDLSGFYMSVSNFAKQFGYEESLEVYKLMDQENLLVEGKLIPPNKLKQVIHVACRAGDFEWARQTLEKYKDKSSKKERVRKLIYQFNMGIIAFNNKDYVNASKYFEYDPKDVNSTYALQWRIIRIKNLYELDKEYEYFTLGVMESTKKYFVNKKNKTKKDIEYKNFMGILINIYRFKHGFTKMKLKNIQEKLENQTLNADRKWLAEKIEELK